MAKQREVMGTEVLTLPGEDVAFARLRTMKLTTRGRGGFVTITTPIGSTEGTIVRTGEPSFRRVREAVRRAREFGVTKITKG